MSNLTNSRLYNITAWKDNAVKIVLTQGEGTSNDNPTYNKAVRFQLSDSDGLLNIPQSANITLAFERPDHIEDIVSGTLQNDSIVEFQVRSTMAAVPGISKGEIRITSTTSVVKFYGINIYVYDGVSNNAIEQSPEFEALIAALQKVVSIDANGNVATMDSVIQHVGTNPVASGLIYDYIETQKQNLEKYVTNVAVDDAMDADTVYRVTTDANGLTVSGIHTLIAVPATNRITQYLFCQDGQILHRYCLAVNGYKSSSWLLWEKVANHSDIPTKVSDLRNDTGFLVASDIAGKANSADVYTKSQVYTKTESDNKYQTLDNKAQSINSSSTVTTTEQANYPSVAAVKNFAYSNFYSQSEIDETIATQGRYVMDYTLPANGWSNGEQLITINAADYDVSAYTMVDVNIDNTTNNSFLASYTAGLYIENDDGVLTAKVFGSPPAVDVTIQLVLSEVNVID